MTLTSAPQASRLNSRAFLASPRLCSPLPGAKGQSGNSIDRSLVTNHGRIGLQAAQRWRFGWSVFVARGVAATVAWGLCFVLRRDGGSFTLFGT